MKRLLSVAGLFVLIVGAFLAGAWFTWTPSASTPSAPSQSTRKVLYWVDPMHPAYKSDKPGIAPDCGMQLEPVYADDPTASVAPVPGAFKVADEKRQVIGVRIGTVDAQPVERTIRTVGRVTADDNRLYRLFAPADGIVTRLPGGYATGALVQKNALLLTFLPRDYDYLKLEQGYLYALDIANGTSKSPLPNDQAQTGLRNALDSLTRIGMDETQVAELAKTRTLMTEIEMRAPAAGYVLERSVSPRQRFDRGAELFRIADLARVWVVVDLFENESQDVRPGTKVRLSRPSARSRPFEGSVSNTLPQFDPDSRTMKIRLEAENTDYALRPGMFVDAEIPVSMPATIAVPVDAVVDAGTRKTVFVDRGNGYFEPRRVETGWRFDDRVEVVSGLKAGERIVLSGAFMLDSESRMKAAAAGIVAGVQDPVCGMEIDQSKAKAAGRYATHRGQTFYFCSDDCKGRFTREPEKYAGAKKP